MTDVDLRLDGNAAAGLLSEVFAVEMTVALETCASCGTTRAIGATHVYSDAPGVVLRCPACEAILICIVRIRGRLLVDMAGVSRLEIAHERD
jgi:hypothetical protein